MSVDPQSIPNLKQRAKRELCICTINMMHRQFILLDRPKRPPDDLERQGLYCSEEL